MDGGDFLDAVSGTHKMTTNAIGMRINAPTV